MLSPGEKDEKVLSEFLDVLVPRVWLLRSGLGACVCWGGPGGGGGT